MLNFFENHYQGDIVAELKRLWGEECKSEETRSQLRWQSKQKWQEKYEEEFNNEEHIKPRKEKSSNQHQKGNRHNQMKQAALLIINKAEVLPKYHHFDQHDHHRLQYSTNILTKETN